MRSISSFFIVPLFILGIVGLFFIPTMIISSCANPEKTIWDCGFEDMQFFPYWWIIVLVIILIGELIFLYMASNDDLTDDLETFFLVKMFCLLLGNGLVFATWGIVWMINHIDITHRIVETLIGIVAGAIIIFAYFFINYLLAAWLGQKSWTTNVPITKPKRRKARRKKK